MSIGMRIAWFTDLSDSLSGICSRQLIPVLRESCEIDIYTAGFQEFQGEKCYNYLSACERHAKRRYDLFFYNFEDRSCCDFIRMHLGLMPGIVWFHNFVMKSFGPDPIINSPWQHVMRKYCFGSYDDSYPWLTNGVEYEKFGPLAYREAAYATSALFSNPVHGADFRQVGHSGLLESRVVSDASSYYLPIPVPEQFFDLASRSSGRRNSVAFASTPTLEGRAFHLLEALSQLPEVKLNWMVEPTGEAKAHELLAQYGVGNYELHVGCNLETWAQVLMTSSVAVHTLYSVYDNPGVYLPASLASGVCCIVDDFGASDYLPDLAVCKVRIGKGETEEIREIIRELASREVVVREAIDYAREVCTVERVKDALLLVFAKHTGVQEVTTGHVSQHTSRSREVLERWEGYIELAGEYLMNSVGRDREFLMPVYSELGWLGPIN